MVSDSRPGPPRPDVAELDRRVRTDELTRLASKAQLVEWLGAALPGAPLALIDLDDFRLLNQSLGHDLGDETLQLVARRLEMAFSEPDYAVARLSQDEFAVLAYDTGHCADELAGRIRRLFHRPFRVEARSFQVRATCGISRCGEAKRANDVIREADTAMYEAKGRAKGGSLVFDESFHERAAESFELVEGLRDALTWRELELHYQPVVDLASGRVVSAEALSRWTHPTMGSIPPDRFVPLAEANGLVGELGQFVLHESLGQRRSWIDAGVVDESFTMAVNLSARQLEEPTFVSSVSFALHVHGCPADRLCLELTETAVMADPAHAIGRLTQLAELDVQISIDDFGTGYSSLSYLQQLPITALKIDRSFVSASDEPRGRALIVAIRGVAAALGLDTVAEGIETEAQRRLLTEVGCDLGQGYLFSRPIPAEQFPGATSLAQVS